MPACSSTPSAASVIGFWPRRVSCDASHSLRWRLMVALLLVFALGFGVSAIFSYGEAYGMLKELSKRTLEGQARELLSALRFRSDGGVEVALPAEWENAYQRLDKSFAYSVFDANGLAVALSSNLTT